MAIRRSKIAGVADSSDPAKIQPSDLDISTTPAVPADYDFKVEATGSSPVFIRGYVYHGGSWRMVFETTY